MLALSSGKQTFDYMDQRHARTVKHRSALLANAAILALAAVSACGPSPPPTAQLYIESDGDFMAFNPSRLTVTAGSHVVLTFRHRGTIISQQHDWVLAKPDTMETLIAEGDKNAAALPADSGSTLRPNDPRVMAATRPISKGESATIEFDAPPPGDYPFFCSTPGHGETMNGVLHVTAP